MILQNLINIIEEKYPKSLACDWDNPGLILGDEKKDVKKVLVSLDVTEGVLEEAVRNEADCIVAHHPLIFSGIKQITNKTPIGRIILKAAQKDIAIYAAHTNMDMAPEGINKKLAEMFGLKNAKIIEPLDTLPDSGLGQIGEVEEITLKDFAKKVKELLKTPFVRWCGEENQIIKRVAIGSGSCGELIPEAINMGADVMVTGDLKYHTCLDFANENFSVIDAGHFPTEQIAMDMFEEIIKNADVEIVKSNNTDIFKIV